MKRARVRTAMVMVLWEVGLAWSPARSVGQCCGDCNGDGSVAINELVTAVNRALGSCQDDGVCDASMATCAAQLGECQGDLADCRAQSGCRAFPASGQTTAYGSGSDGDVRAGAALSYTDNGDGSITDNNTGLMWEKKDDSGGIHAGGIHARGNLYIWGSAWEPYAMDGTIVTEFLAALNATPCFAGHCDWRIPNVRELQSIVDYEIPYPGPTVDAAFHDTEGCAGCTDVTLASCSCTASNLYWSSTTPRDFPDSAWYVDFSHGNVGIFKTKAYAFAVRAVRGGL